MTDQYKKIAEALRVCGGGVLPCGCCPFHMDLDPYDCQTQIMIKAAEILENLAEAKA